MKQKIFQLEKLQKILEKQSEKGKKVVLCHGVFDLLHIGHIKHFEEAKNFGDILIVSVTTDKYVNKGPGRPAFTEPDRLRALAALKAIDYVVLSKYPTATNIIKELKPNFYCKGQDYKFIKNDITGEIKNELNALKKIGGKKVYTKGPVFSSSNLINKFVKIHSTQQKTIIDKIKKKYSFFSPNILNKVICPQNGERCLDIAAAPPKYCSVLISFKASIGSLPDFPRALQKTYWSIIVSPITRTFKFLKFSILFFISKKEYFFLILSIIVFCWVE